MFLWLVQLQNDWSLFQTRVLVTNAVTYLQKVDWIIVMNKGEISEAGTFQYLLEKRGAFADFLNQHLNIMDSDTESLEGETIEYFLSIKKHI